MLLTFTYMASCVEEKITVVNIGNVKYQLKRICPVFFLITMITFPALLN